MTHRRVPAIILTFTLSACYTYQPVGAAVQPSQPVRVTYEHPHSVPVIGAGGAAPILDVMELVGQVQRASQDSLWLSLPRAVDAGGVARTLPNGATAVVVRGPYTRIETRHASTIRTMAVMALAGAAAYFIIGSIAVDNMDMDITLLRPR